MDGPHADGVVGGGREHSILLRMVDHTGHLGREL